MKEQLIKYVELLFAGNSDAEDMKQEILQNTLDKYDDYIAQGKSAEAAYRLAISGIGDISEILGSSAEPASSPAPATAAATDYRGRPVTPMWKKILRAIAVFLFIVSLIPLIVLADVGSGAVGLVGTVAIVAVGVLLLIIAGGNESTEKEVKNEDNSPAGQLKKAIGNIITVVGLLFYFWISFESGAWHITWLVFPIMGAIQGVVNGIVDLFGGSKHED